MAFDVLRREDTSDGRLVLGSRGVLMESISWIKVLI